MKRSVSILLLICLLLSLSACQKEQVKIQVPVNFYYLRQNGGYGESDSLIAPLTAEAMGYANNYLDLLNAYLQGPKDNDYRSPFPANTTLLSLNIVGGVAYLQLSTNFSYLTGINLTVACACLTLTTLDMVEATSVRITADSATLNGADYIQMDRQSLTLLDIYVSDN